MNGKFVRAGSREPVVGEGQAMAYLLTSEDTGGQLEWMDATIEFGAGPVYHIHHNADEVLMVLDGELKVKMDGELLDIRPGDVLFVPRSVPHTFTNIHRDRPVRAIGMYTPAGIQEFLHKWEALFAAGKPNETAMAELVARYGQEAVGPPLAVELGLVETTQP